MPVQVIIKRKIKINAPEKLIQVISKLRERGEKQPGHISGETLRNIDKPNDYMVISTWETANDWQNWFASQERRELQGQVDSLIGERTFYDIYEPVND